MADEPHAPTVEQMEQVFEQELRSTEEALRTLTDEELREMERLLEPLTSAD